MIRPFDLRDVPLVAQLENQGTSLYNEFALTRGSHPLQSALAGYLTLHTRGEYTHVSPGQPAGLAQMRRRTTVPRAVVTFVSPSLATGNGIADVWTQLLESLAKAAGELGLQQLIAEISEDGAEITALHRTGFAVLLRQDILRLKEWNVVEPPRESPLRRCAETDTWSIQQLYLNTVPRLAQQAETLPSAHHSSTMCSYVLEEGGEATAYLEIRRGPCGAWFNVVIHPQAERCASQVITHGLAQLGPSWTTPVYCCVRRYQEWLQEPLQSLGFEPFTSTAVMVKRLIVPVVEDRVPTPVLVQPKATTPVVRSQISVCFEDRCNNKR